MTDWAGRFQLDGKDAWRDCRLVDVSGSRVVVEPVGTEPNERLEGIVVLELESVAETADPVQLRGEIRRVRRTPLGRAHVEMDFIAMSAIAEQLLDLLFALRTLA